MGQLIQQLITGWTTRFPFAVTAGTPATPLPDWLWGACPASYAVSNGVCFLGGWVREVWRLSNTCTYSPGPRIYRHWPVSVFLNRLTPNDPYMGRTAPLTSKRCILYIYSTNTGTEYFKHALYSPFFSLQNAVCFIMLTCLVPVLFTFYIHCVLKLKKKKNSGAKGLTKCSLLVHVNQLRHKAPQHPQQIPCFLTFWRRNYF